MFEIKKSKTLEGWEEWSLEKIQEENEHEDQGPAMSFVNDIQNRLMLGRYKYHNLVVELSSMPIYGESDDSIALSFIIGDKRVDGHGLYKANDFIAVPTDRDGNAIKLSFMLPDDFYEWLETTSEKLRETGA